MYYIYDKHRSKRKQIFHPLTEDLFENTVKYTVPTVKRPCQKRC